MSKLKRLRPHHIAFLIDASVILFITLLALFEQDRTTNEIFLDWYSLLHYIPLYIMYAISVSFFLDYKKRHNLTLYIMGPLLSCIVVSVVWVHFFYSSLPATRNEQNIDQFNENQIILDDNSTKKIAQWVDEEHLSSNQLIDSCKAMQEEKNAEMRIGNETTSESLVLLVFLFSTMTVVISVTACHFAFQSVETENERREAEKLRIEAEHKLLQYQLNPHFLMNTLNNIHAQIDIDSEAAQESVRMLSKMMRYMLYETSQDKVPLSKEVEFLSNYFEMMRRRYIDSVDIKFIVPQEIPNISVPPALFINLVENAFKHGVTYNSNSYVHFELTVDAHTITCRVENSKIKNKADIRESFGFGVESLRKRLNLLYGKHHTYDIRETDNEYNVLLTIPIV